MRKERKEMPATKERNSLSSLNDHIAIYMRADRDFVDGIRKGVKDCKEGRVRPWSEIKKEMNLK